MKTKKEVLADISKSKGFRKALRTKYGLRGKKLYKVEAYYRYTEHLMRGFLGHKEVDWYYCNNCEVPHAHFKCPLCQCLESK